MPMMATQFQQEPEAIVFDPRENVPEDGDYLTFMPENLGRQFEAA